MPEWVHRCEKADIELMAQTLNISRVMAQVLVNRGVRTKNTALRFLNPRFEDFHDALLMRDMCTGLETVAHSIKQGEKIVIYGDYDADGVMATVILFKTLSHFGADVFYYIPQRVEEGYGLNMSAVNGVFEAGVNLIITCDNGIAALEEIAAARALGMKVVVLDHHEAVTTEEGDCTLPAATAVIDPKQTKCKYPFKSLCAGGLAYKFSKAFYAHMGTEFDAEEEMLVLAMIATICDIVELHGENRIISHSGLVALNRKKTLNIGLGALVEAKGYMHREIDSTAIGFIIGPCINASGRLEHARFAVDLFTTEDPEEARDLAQWLVKLNESRRDLTRASFEAVDAQLAQSKLSDLNVLVIYDKNTHESIAGIVAGRIKDKYYKPTIIITEGDDCLKGSARSVEGYNIFEELHKCRDLFVRFGGHAMAAGLSMNRQNVDELRNRLNEAFNLSGNDLVPNIYYDSQLEIDEVTYSLAQELTYLKPFGKDNRPPLFFSRAQTVTDLRVIENKNTVIMTLASYGCARKVKAIGFGIVDSLRQSLQEYMTPQEVEEIISGEIRQLRLKLDLLYELEINEYNGTVSVQMRIRHLRPSA